MPERSGSVAGDDEKEKKNLSDFDMHNADDSNHRHFGVSKEN